MVGPPDTFFVAAGFVTEGQKEKNISVVCGSK
jgi:hypothetical protein